MPDALITTLYFFVSLFPLVLVHEFGHFVLAKLNGIKVEEFGIGFPPRLARLFTVGETEYTLNWLPLGGFVKLPGMDDPDIEGGFLSAGAAGRSIVLLAGPIANILFAAILLAGLGWAFGSPVEVAPRDTVRIAGVIEGQPAARAGVREGDVLVAIDGRPLGEIALDGAAGATPAMSALMNAARTAGEEPVRLTLVRGLESPMSVEVSEGVSAAPETIGGLEVLRVEEAVGAEGAADDPGLMAGDLIVGEAGPPEPGQRVVVLRPSEDGGAVDVVDYAVVPNDGAIGVYIEALGFQERLGPVAALGYGVGRSIELTGLILDGLRQMVTGSLEADLAGPVGIARLGREAGEAGIAPLIGFMVMLSINLAIFNLLPIPGLDGGRLVFIAFEALRGRRLEPRREELVHIVGIVVVIGLVLWITVNEVFGIGPMRSP